MVLKVIGLLLGNRVLVHIHTHTQTHKFAHQKWWERLFGMLMKCSLNSWSQAVSVCLLCSYIDTDSYLCELWQLRWLSNRSCICVCAIMLCNTLNSDMYQKFETKYINFMYYCSIVIVLLDLRTGVNLIVVVEISCTHLGNYLYLWVRPNNRCMCMWCFKNAYPQSLNF